MTTKPCEYCGHCEDPEHCVWSVTCPECRAEPREQCRRAGGLAPLHAARWAEAGAIPGVIFPSPSLPEVTGVMGVMAVDPGQSTGVAWAMVPTVGPTASRLACRYHYGSQTLTGAWLEQGKEVARLFQEFREWCYNRQRSPTYLVIEDFILLKLGSSNPEGLTPVRVAAAAMGYRLGRADKFEDEFKASAAEIGVTFQAPSDAMTFATSERLKRWGLWVKGKEHERDAWRHLATFVARRNS